MQGAYGRGAAHSATGSTTCRARPSRRRRTSKALHEAGRVGRRPGSSTTTTTPSATTTPRRQFAKGKGVFFVRAATGRPPSSRPASARTLGMINMPPGPSGQARGHRGDLGPVAHLGEDEVPGRRRRVAELHHRLGPAKDAMFKTRRSRPSRARRRRPSDRSSRRRPAAWQQLVKDGGLTLYADWASPSDVRHARQGVPARGMAGKTSPADAAKAIQADWAKFDAELK